MSVLNKGKWIRAERGLREEEAETRIVCFRKEITLSEVAKEVPIGISADSRYKLYVNGTLACFGPCKGG